MKKYLLLLWLLLPGCQGQRLLPVPALPEAMPAQPEGYAALDSVPAAAVNAAQMPLFQPDMPPAAPLSVAPGRPAASTRQAAWPADTAKIYTRHPPIDVRPMNRLARTSLWLGIGTYVATIIAAATSLGAFSLIAFLASIAAVTTGIVSLSELKRSPDKFRGRGQAIAGLVLGGLFILLGIVALVLLLVFLSSW